MRSRLSVLLSSLAVMIVTAMPSLAQTPTVERMNWAPPGSTWVLQEKLQASYGSGTVRYTVTALGEQPWQNQKLRAFQLDRPSDDRRLAYANADGFLVAVTRGTQVLVAFEPYFAGYTWPLAVGKSWPNRYRYIDNESRQVFDNVQYDGTVKAFEDIKVPAGTFKAFRIVLGNRFADTTNWWAPDLGITVKTVEERARDHYKGWGKREVELISLDLK